MGISRETLMAALLQAKDRGAMLLRRKSQAGFTITELMIVLVIIGVLAAIATPSLTRDTTARKGRDFANMVAQGMLRAHLEAMSSRTTQIVRIFANRVEFWQQVRLDLTLQRTLPSPAYAGDGPHLAIWNVTNTEDAAPTVQVLQLDSSQAEVSITFNPIGNALLRTSTSSVLANCRIYIRNEFLPPNHPDAGFMISMTGLTSAVSTQNFRFSQ
jgi:prepilin-type N-terminal cleavage/methylation domain-containing protein